jgi:glycosyltransferase involved in cell wall biosynthesis
VALAHARPTVTTVGPQTEPLWLSSRAVALAPGPDVDSLLGTLDRILRDEAERTRMGAAARALYNERFDVRNLISTLRKEPERPPATMREPAETVDASLDSFRPARTLR